MGWTPLRDYPARRIVIIKPSSLGDIVHALPVLSALRYRYPHAHIAWMVNRSYEPLLRGQPDLNEILPFDRGAVRKGVMPALHTYRRFIHDLRRKHFDLVIDLQGLLRSGLITGVSGAARRVGLSSAREGARWFYSDLVQVVKPNEMHAIDRYWLVADRFGVGDRTKEFRLRLAPDAEAWADQLLAPLPRPWVCVGVGSRWLTKRWLPEHFAELVRRTQANFGGTALLVGSPDEARLSQYAAQQIHGPVRVLTGTTTLPQLTALLSRADLMIANDTGPLHLAAALDRPVLAPYTCTKVVRTGPYGERGYSVEAPIWCQGSYLKHCKRLECMNELTPDHLWPYLQEILHQWQRRSLSA